jgi:hypothetical protein
MGYREPQEVSFYAAGIPNVDGRLPLTELVGDVNGRNVHPAGEIDDGDEPDSHKNRVDQIGNESPD